MVLVIEKTFGILERIVSSVPAPMTPAQLADELDLNRATCSRLLKQLTDSGYLVQISRRQGYAPGPKLLTLANAAQFERGLLDAARPVIDLCAEELRSSVLLAKLYNRKRYVLYHRSGCPELNIRITQPCYGDIFCTATGLLLAAYCPRAEQIACLREMKAAGTEILPGFGSERTLPGKLSAIAGDGFFACAKGRQWIYAFPVFRDGRFCAALGASIPQDRHTPAVHRTMCRVLKQAAKTVSRELSAQYTIG